MAGSHFFKAVTLLITHYNRSSSLERLLKTCSDLKYSFEDIIVSDDCSNDEHMAKILLLQKQFDFKLVTTPLNKGLGHNINKGQKAVSTPYTLYVQEDFVPLPAFAEHFLDGFGFMEDRKDLDFVRFYSYIPYPDTIQYKKGFLEMIYKPWSTHYHKIYFYCDHPHLRRSNFIEKFGLYTEGVSVDRSEYRMCISFIQNGGKGLLFEEYKSLFRQENPVSEPSTTPRNVLTVSDNPIIRILRDTYRQLRYNYDLRYLKIDNDKNRLDNND